MPLLTKPEIFESQSLMPGISPFKEPALKTLGIVIVLAWLFSLTVLNKITLVSRESVKSNLNTVLLGTQDSLNAWATDHKGNVRTLTGAPQIAEDLLQILSAPSNSEYLQKLKGHFQSIMSVHQYQEFFLLTTDYINIASSHDFRIGQKFVLKDDDNFLKKVFAGNTVLSPPIMSDASEQSEAINIDEPTMFVASPVLDPSGKVIAALTFSIEPQRDFTRTLQIGRIGASGETYAFNSQGKLISESRFSKQLTEFGIIPPDGRAILSIDIKDPGGNLLKGYKPYVSMEQRPFTFMARQAIDKKPGTNVEGYRDYRGVSVVGAWTWNEDLSLGIATEIDKEEAYQQLNTTRFLVMTFLGGTVFLFLGYSLNLFRQGQKNIIEAQKIRVFSMAVDHSSSSIVITNNQGTILYVNPAFYKLTGYSQEEAIGKNPKILKSGKHSKIFYKKMWDLLLSEKSWEGQICNKRKSGELYWEHQVISPIKDDHGKVSYFISVKLDDTKRKASIDSLLAKVVEFEESNNRLRDFANNASHDLQAPLRKVMTFSKHLKAHCSSLDDKSRDYIDRMEKSTERMHNLVTRLLEYSKLPGEPIERSPVNLNEIVAGVKEDLDLDISERNAVLNIEDLPTLNAVPHQMTQLFQNLISNSLKFSKKDQVSNIDISASNRDSGSWEIIFRDNGIGLDQKDAERIFNPLERLHGVSKYPGAGMGLAICKKIVEQHNGTITARSIKGEGTTFTLILPV